MIKIGIDGRLLQGTLTGVGKYVLNLIDYVCDNSDGIIFSVYTNRPLACNLRADRVTIHLDDKYSQKVKPMVWSKLLSFKLINTDKPDIFFAGDAFVPLWIKTKKIISLVHDLNSYIAPDTMSSLRLITDKLFLKADLKKATLVTTNSFGTAEKLKQYYQTDTDLVIHPIMDKQYQLISKSLINKKLAEMNVNYPYILTVSTQEPRKNMEKTIAAFLSLKNKGLLEGYKLLLVGSKGWKSDNVQNLIKQHVDEVISLGYVPDEQIPYLYGGAKLFVFPSSYEGFGMPAREAMLCGTQVVVSDIPELREATYNIGNYINPDDQEQFEENIIKAISEGRQINPNMLKSTDQLPMLIEAIYNL